MFSILTRESGVFFTVKEVFAFALCMESITFFYRPLQKSTYRATQILGTALHTHLIHSYKLLNINVDKLTLISYHHSHSVNFDSDTSKFFEKSSTKQFTVKEGISLWIYVQLFLNLY